MNGEVVSSYLRVKFSSALHEAETDLGSSLPILSRFRAIERLINTISDVHNSSTQAEHLYSLMDVLSEYRDHSVVQLLEMLQLQLMGKRYLIVLDDAWRMDEWFADLGCITGQPGAESFTHGLPKGSGGAVIVTSRGEGVIRRMVGKQEYVIRPRLSDETCWKIFSDAIVQGKIRPDDPMLIKMQACITKNCEGLAVAAQTLANLNPKLVAESREEKENKMREERRKERMMIDLENQYNSGVQKYYKFKTLKEGPL